MMKIKKKLKIIFSIIFALAVSFFLDKPIAQLMVLIKNPVLDVIMNWFSNEITVFIVLFIISAIFLYEEHKKRYIPVLFASFILGLIVSKIFKLVIARPRPYGLSYDTYGLGNYKMNLPDYSYPSSHATTAFSVLPLLDKELKHIKYFWIFFSSMIAISRIYLNQHYLSDVIAGIILGYLIGYYIFKLEEKHGMAKKIYQKI